MIQQRRRKDGSIAYYVTVDYPATPTKRRDRRCGTFDTLREAKAAEREWKTEADRGDRPPSQQTLAAFLATWLETKRHKRQDTTVDSYREYVEVLIVPRIGQVRLDRVNDALLQKFVNDLRDNGRKDGTGGLSSSRVNGARRVLAMAFKYAHGRRLIQHNPMLLVEPVAHEAKEYPEWTDAHLDRFLAVALATPLAPYWLLALVTGMRRGELLGLRWQDIDWEVGSLHLRQQNRALRGVADRAKLKSKRPRVVQLGPEMLSVLAEHRTRQKAHIVQVRLDWHDHDLVFCADDGKPWNPTSLTHMFTRLVQQAGVPHIKLHLLRAINASVSVAEGADPRTLADRLGHSRPSTTADHYLLRSAGRQRAVAEAVEDVIMKRKRG